MDAKALLDAVPEALIAADAGDSVLELNPAAQALTGWTAAELKGQPLSKVLPRRDGNPVPCLRKDGTQLTVQLSISAAGPVRVALLRPASAESGEAERYRLLFENAPVAILHFDAHGLVTACNEAMEQMLGSSKRVLVGMNLLRLGGDRSRDRIAELVGEALRGNRVRYEGTYRAVTSGKAVEVSAVIAPIHTPAGAVQGGVAIALDVSERKRIQAQLARTDRMASIGTLAAGVAHEINNPLVYVTLGLELIERELSRFEKAPASAEDFQRVHGYCKDAIDGAERVRTIVRDLRTFSRQGDDRTVPVEVEKVLESSINLAMSHIRPRARVEREYQRVPQVLGDESRLGQVFLNLLVNAAQAIPEGAPDRHRIVLRTALAEPGQIAVEVEDTGVGIEGWKLERIFEPFWTDKPVGVGTGLGLSIAHAIVTGLGGSITVRSEPGRGSTFRVTLPTDGARAIGEEQQRAAAEPAPPPTRRPRMLLIDDEPHLGTTLSTGLREVADVVSVRSGTEAIRLLLQDDAFDLILCDLMMPDLTGMDVYERIGSERPHLRSRFVFTTGGAVTQRAREFVEARPDQRLDKPFRLEQVEALLQRMLR